MYSCFQHSFIPLLCVNVKAIPFENYFNLEQSYYFPPKEKRKKESESQSVLLAMRFDCAVGGPLFICTSLKQLFSLTDSVSTFPAFPIMIKT